MRIVYYCMSHPPHAPYLVTSLLTLRRHWKGPVKVFAWPQVCNIIDRIDEDESLCVESVRHVPEYYGKNDQFLDKIHIARRYFHQDDVVLYLDADTTIHGSLEPLFEAAEKHGFAATQFNNWRTHNGIAHSRVNALRAFPQIPVGLIDRVTTTDYPSVNGGVWAVSPLSPVLPIWYNWTMSATVPNPMFIADERVLHLMIERFPESEYTVMEGGMWNCSPMERYQPKDLKDEDVIIRHYHGDSCCRPSNKSQKGWDLWSPIYRECLEKNVGGIQEWIGTVNNRWMNKLPAMEIE